MFLLACVYIGTTSTYGDHRSCSCLGVYILGLRAEAVVQYNLNSHLLTLTYNNMRTSTSSQAAIQFKCISESPENERYVNNWIDALVSNGG